MAHRFLNYSIFSLFILLAIFGVATKSIAKVECSGWTATSSAIGTTCASCVTSLTNTQGSCCGPMDDPCSGRTEVKSLGCGGGMCSARVRCCITLPDCSVTAVATPNPIPAGQDSVTISAAGSGYTSCIGTGTFTQTDPSKIYTVNCTGDVNHSNCSNTVTVTKNSGTAIIASSCGVDSATVTAVVAGGITPYKKYTWYKQIGSGSWIIDYEEFCPSSNGSCISSHIYLLSGQTINAYLRVEDNRGDFWSSNILNINCNGSSKCGCNGTTRTCDVSGTGANCSDISSCPLCETATSKCGINPNGSMFCGTGTLGLSGTGGSCNFASDCGVCKKR